MAYEKIKYNQAYNKEHYYRPSIYLPLEYKERLKQVAMERTNGNVSQLVTNAIDEYLKKLNED